MIEILYRGKGYVVVNKPVGADSEDTGEGSVPSLVREELNIPYADPCHRLDKVARGAMLVATDKRAAARLGAAVQNKEITKEYLCVCEGTFAEGERTGEMQDMLYFDRAKRKSYTVKKERRGVKTARLLYEVLGEHEYGGRAVSLCRVILDTGRTHQIRVQFASRGHSLLGDGKYGSHDNSTSVALMCHAVTVDGVRVECCEVSDAFPFLY